MSLLFGDVGDDDDDDDDNLFPNLSGVEVGSFVDEDVAQPAAHQASKDSLFVDGVLLEGPFSRLFTTPTPQSYNETKCDTPDADFADNSRNFDELVDWVIKSGGYVHPST